MCLAVFKAEQLNFMHVISPTCTCSSTYFSFFSCIFAQFADKVQDFLSHFLKITRCDRGADLARQEVEPVRCYHVTSLRSYFGNSHLSTSRTVEHSVGGIEHSFSVLLIEAPWAVAKWVWARSKTVRWWVKAGGYIYADDCSVITLEVGDCGGCWLRWQNQGQTVVVVNMWWYIFTAMYIFMRVINIHAAVQAWSWLNGFVCHGAREREAVRSAGGSSEFTNAARLGEHGKTSRHRISPAIFRLPLFTATKVGGLGGGDPINDLKWADFDECRGVSSHHLHSSLASSEHCYRFSSLPSPLPPCVWEHVLYVFVQWRMILFPCDES